MQKSINIPDDLVETIERAAERERRSFTQQVVFFLENAVSRHTTAEGEGADKNPTPSTDE